MEIRINKEIKDYHESLFFGLSFRQFICSALAVGTAAGVYFGLKDVVGKETVSWICILCAAPMAAAGFFKYNGMLLEEFITAFICSEFIFAGKRVFKSENILYNLYRTTGSKLPARQCEMRRYLRDVWKKTKIKKRTKKDT